MTSMSAWSEDGSAASVGQCEATRCRTSLRAELLHGVHELIWTMLVGARRVVVGPCIRSMYIEDNNRERSRFDGHPLSPRPAPHATLDSTQHIMMMAYKQTVGSTMRRLIRRARQDTSKG